MMLSVFRCEGCGYFCRLSLGKTLLHQLQRMLMLAIKHIQVTLRKTMKVATDP